MLPLPSSSPLFLCIIKSLLIVLLLRTETFLFRLRLKKVFAPESVTRVVSELPEVSFTVPPLAIKPLLALLLVQFPLTVISDDVVVVDSIVKSFTDTESSKVSVFEVTEKSPEMLHCPANETATVSEADVIDKSPSLVKSSAKETSPSAETVRLSPASSAFVKLISPVEVIWLLPVNCVPLPVVRFPVILISSLSRVSFVTFKSPVTEKVPESLITFISEYVVLLFGVKL